MRHLRLPWTPSPVVFYSLSPVEVKPQPVETFRRAPRRISRRLRVRTYRRDTLHVHRIYRFADLRWPKNGNPRQDPDSRLIVPIPPLISSVRVTGDFPYALLM